MPKINALVKEDKEART
jgi:hypothetical protein